MKKLLSLLLVVTLTATLAVGGTLAYLTDRDSKANVFTVGNVKIDLEEDFQQGATLIPGVNIEKKPTITNEGPNDAWVWLEFAIPSALDQAIQGTEQGSADNVIHWNPLGATAEGYVNDTRVANAIEAGHLPVGTTAADILANNTTWNVFNSIETGKNMYQTDIEVDGEKVPYNVYVLLYNKALTPGETTLPSIYNVFLDARVDIDPDGNWNFVENGVATSIDWNSNDDGAPVIYVSAYAMQKENFATVNEAYAAYQKQWADKGTEYGIVVYDLGVTETGTYELDRDLNTVDTGYFHTQAVTDTVTINGNGATVTGIATSIDAFQWEGGTIPAMSPIFSSANGSQVTVNDLTFTGTMSAIMLGHYQNATYNNYNTELNNVNVIDAEVVSFSSNVSPAVCVYGTAYLNNCEITGTTLSELDTDPMWPVYDLAAVNYSDVTINDSKIGSIYMWNQAKVTVAAGSEVDTIVIRGNMTPPKYGLTVEDGAKVAAIDLSNITNKAKVNITIKDGAAVDKFVANGVEYATLEAWQNA